MLNLPWTQDISKPPCIEAPQCILTTEINERIILLGLLKSGDRSIVLPFNRSTGPKTHRSWQIGAHTPTRRTTMPLPPEVRGLLSGAAPPGTNLTTLLSDKKASDIFPGARCPKGALAGLQLKHLGWAVAHETAESDGLKGSKEGSYWHAIVHREEPDTWNSGYWFDRVGRHPTFSALRDETLKVIETAKLQGDASAVAAAAVLVDVAVHGDRWDPYAFNKCYELAHGRGDAKSGTLSDDQRTALLVLVDKVREAEWRLLFEYCASPPS